MAIRGVTGWRPERLRAARRKAGLTQSALAAHLGLATWTVSAWERADGQAPTVRHLTDLARALGTSPYDLAPLPPAATLRDLRQRAGLRTVDLAVELGITDASVSAIELRAAWWPSSADRWAALLGVDADTFHTAWEAGRPPP